MSEDTALSADRTALRDVVRRFVERDVLPTVAERERNAAYPTDLLPALADMGVLGMSIPAEHGGTELDMVSFAHGVK